jgi:hypothetical protein
LPFSCLVLGEDLGTLPDGFREHMRVRAMLNSAVLYPDRERCFEIRTMTAGSFSLLKPGDLHALFNVTDEDISLLIFRRV